MLFHYKAYLKPLHLAQAGEAAAAAGAHAVLNWLVLHYSALAATIAAANHAPSDLVLCAWRCTWLCWHAVQGVRAGCGDDWGFGWKDDVTGCNRFDSVYLCMHTASRMIFALHTQHLACYLAPRGCLIVLAW